MDDWGKLWFEHAQRHFTTHAAQRMALFQFALAFWAGIYAALGTALQYDLDAFGRAAALVGLGATIVFWLLDQRTRALVKISEKALTEFEVELAKNTGATAICIVAACDTKRLWPPTYTQSFRLIYIFNFAILCTIGFPEMLPMIQAETTSAWTWITNLIR